MCMSVDEGGYLQLKQLILSGILYFARTEKIIKCEKESPNSSKSKSA